MHDALKMASPFFACRRSQGCQIAGISSVKSVNMLAPAFSDYSAGSPLVPFLLRVLLSIASNP
jgi:hypothetical protein